MCIFIPITIVLNINRWGSAVWNNKHTSYVKIFLIKSHFYANRGDIFFTFSVAICITIWINFIISSVLQLYIIFPVIEYPALLYTVTRKTKNLPPVYVSVYITRTLNNNHLIAFIQLLKVCMVVTCSLKSKSIFYA